jgi:hypothetical protein
MFDVLPSLASYVKIFVAMLVVAIVVAVVWRPKRPTQWLALTAMPFGCAALPIVGLMLLVGISALFQKSDASLFEEVWGFVPDMREDQMLSDDFGIWSNRWIYMRMEPSPHDRQRVINVTRPSTVTPLQFDFTGDGRGLEWWDTHCAEPTLREADGYRDWRMLVVLDCPERREMWFIAHQP